jgi:hypothetical protein
VAVVDCDGCVGGVGCGRSGGGGGVESFRSQPQSTTQAQASDVAKVRRRINPGRWRSSMLGSRSVFGLDIVSEPWAAANRSTTGRID